MLWTNCLMSVGFQLACCLAKDEFELLILLSLCPEELGL